MESRVSKSHFKAHALEILRHVETTGEQVIVTDRGRPTLVVRRYAGEARDPRQVLKGSVLRYDDPFLPVDEEAWESVG